MDEHQKPWNALTVEQVAVCFEKAPFPWWIAGGMAIELAIGKKIREHKDIDIFVLRNDHIELRTLLADWDCWVADPPGTLRSWPVGQALRRPIHDIWCRESSLDEWRFQVMLDESSVNEWISRRDEKVSLPLESITRKTESGIRYLAPHIQLYYKARNVREKDQLDLEAVLAHQATLDSEWLRWAISHSYGTNHPWLERLSE